MKKKIIILIAILFFGYSKYGLTQDKFELLEDLDYSISYFGNNAWNPGLQFSIEKLISEKEKTKIRKETSKTNYKQRLLTANLGFYVDNPTHWAIFNNYQYTLRRISHKNRFLSISAGVGALRTFLPETYGISSNGNIEKKLLPGRYYFTPVISLGLGKLKHKTTNRGWQFKLHNFWLYKYNGGIVPQVHLELGYKFGGKKQSAPTE